MSDTSAQSPSPTGMTPGIAPDRIMKGISGSGLRDLDIEESGRVDKVIVRVPKSKTSVNVRLNTKLLAEQREIESINEAIRRAGR